MTMIPRSSTFIGVGASLLMCATFAPVANAQLTYPAKPVRFVVGYPPGQTIGNLARASAKALTDILGKQVYMYNKPGATEVTSASSRA